MGGRMNLMLRRRAMMTKKSKNVECPYITSGLIFWLDGIEIGSSGDWDAAIGNATFTLNGNVSYDNNGFVFGGTVQDYMTSPKILPYGADYTIEAVIRVDSSATGAVFMSGSAGGTTKYSPMVFPYGTTSILMMNRCGKVNTTADLRSISYNVDHCVINGADKSIITATDYWSTNGNTKLGCEINRLAFKGKIFCIRYYDRKLSADEMKSNHRIDDQRFNLGLNL